MLLVAALCAGCANSHYASHWDGRRGYDGRGDYGYDVAASQSEAGRYRAGAARQYPVPGTPGDPWGPYVREAGTRFQVPERWIREVMRQESGGRLYDAGGLLVTSSAGAMGLMQIIPRTYDRLRGRYGLGPDPYDPHDNILAGTAYIREMYDRYGAPAFLAAYNAGPDRLDAYLAGTSPLPGETVNYLATVAPRLGSETAMTGPLAMYATGAGAGNAAQDRVYAGGGMSGADYYAARQAAPVAAPDMAAGRPMAASDDPSLQAFDGGGLVTPEAPTGMLVPAVVRSPGGAAPAPTGATGSWGIQVGAFPDPNTSEAAIAEAQDRARAFLGDAQAAVTPAGHGVLFYRARFIGLSAANATAACRALASEGLPCFTVPPGS